jgi:poly-gamma-glutamate synthesis protein (capsule biosynthesis protein)
MSSYSRISSKDIFSDLPGDLPALCFVKRKPIARPVRLLAVGDIGLSGRIRETCEQNNYHNILSGVADFLRTGDIVFGNLECTLNDDLPSNSLFVAPTQAIDALNESGFTLLHVANNHIYDYGQEGFASSLKAVSDAGITSLGITQHSPHFCEVVRTDHNGIHIGWIGSGRTLVAQLSNPPYYSEFDETLMINAIKNARQQVDVLIVSLHIGFMLITYPDPLHRDMTHRLLDAGADIVLCHHAHVLQGVEVSQRGKIVIHNFGNLIFDWQEGRVALPVAIQEQNESIILCLDIDKQGVCFCAALPVFLDPELRVAWAKGERGNALLNRLEGISNDLDGNYIPKYWRQRAERNSRHVLNMLRYYVQHRQWRDIFTMLFRIRPRHFNAIVYRLFGRK